MFARYRTAFMNTVDALAGGAPTPPATPAAAAPVAPAPPTTPPAAPSAGEEFKNMTPEQFSQRLSKEREQGTKALVRELGFEKVDDVKALLVRAKEEAEAKKSEQQKMQEKIAALEPSAKKAVELEAAVQKYLASEEAAIPEAKKGMLSLAPTDAHARLEWIANAKALGLFTVAAPVAPTTPTPAPLANTRAGNGNPPPPAPPAGQKHPREMTDAEFKAYEAQWKASNSAPRG